MNVVTSSRLSGSIVILCLCAGRAGSADAGRRQEAGAGSCLAFPRRHQRRIRGRVTPHTERHAVERAPAPGRAAGVASL
jgi:hypothetical protein